VVQLWESKSASPTSTTWKAETNDTLFDRFAIGHAAGGMWLGAAGIGIIPSLIYHTAFEIFENYFLKAALPQIFPDASSDSIINIIGDSIAFIAGWTLNLKDTTKDDPWIGEWSPMALVRHRVNKYD